MRRSTPRATHIIFCLDYLEFDYVACCDEGDDGNGDGKRSSLLLLLLLLLRLSSLPHHIQHKFPGIVRVAMFFLAIVFSLFGGMGYLAYGEDTEVSQPTVGSDELLRRHHGNASLQHFLRVSL